MKYLNLLIIGLLISATCMAEETIKLRRKEQKEKDMDKRTLTITPIASIDRNILYLYSDVLIEDVEIIVTDNMGNIIYTSTISIYGQHPIYLPETTGELLIELKIGDDYYYGYFEMT